MLIICWLKSYGLWFQVICRHQTQQVSPRKKKKTCFAINPQSEMIWTSWAVPFMFSIWAHPLGGLGSLCFQSFKFLLCLCSRCLATRRSPWGGKKYQKVRCFHHVSPIKKWECSQIVMGGFNLVPGGKLPVVPHKAVAEVSKIGNL